MTLHPANVPAHWRESESWRNWCAPCNIVVGESRRQDALLAVCGGAARQWGYLVPVELEFRREPDNQYDPNAIVASIEQHTVGYLRREIAATLAGPLDAIDRLTFRLCGLIRGGSERAPLLGAHVWIGQRLSPAPVILGCAQWLVPWEPYDSEGEA